MADIQTAGSPTLNDASALDKAASQAPSATTGDVLPLKPTVENDPVAEKPLDTAASIPSDADKPDLPPVEAVPEPPINEANGNTRMSEPNASGTPLMAGALQDEPPKPAGTDIVAPAPVKEDSLVKDVIKDDAPVAEKPAETKPVDELPVRPSAPDPEAAQEPVQDPAAEASKPEMEANTNGQADKEESDELPSTSSKPEATTEAPVADKPSTEAAEEAKLDAMPALAAEIPVVGEKRAADQTDPHEGLNDDSDDHAAPAAKKQKVDKETKPAKAAATNGGVKKSNSKAKKDKKPPPQVGRTARKTRSQAAAEV